MRFGRTVSTALLACLLAGAAIVPSHAAPADDIAQYTLAIEDALADKQPVDAEALARDALRLAETAFGAESLEAANLRRLLGDSLFNQDEFEDAEPHYRLALSIREKLLGRNHLDTAVSANDMGLVLKRLGRYVEATPFYLEVLEIKSAVLGPNHEQTARAAFWYARIFDANGQYAEAAVAMGDAVARATIALGPRDPLTVEWMGERAAMLHDSGDIAAAEPAYLEAIELAQQVYEADDGRLAFVQQGLANLYAGNGRAAEAVPLYRSALAIREAAFGADDSATIRSLDGLARALWAIEQVVEADEAFRRLLAVRERTSGPDSVEAADSLRWIGRAASAQNHRAEAELLFKRALAISEEKLGPDHVLTGYDLIALGQLYSGQQRFIEARPLLQRAVAIFESEEGDRRSASAGRMALSFLELATGNAPLATELAQRSLNDVMALDGPQSRTAADIMLSLGGYHLDTGNLVAAERLVAEARTVYAAIAPDSRAAIRATSELGRIREGQGRYDEALTLHNEALAALTARYGADNGELQPALSDLGSTLFALGDFAAAATALEQSTAIVERLAAIDTETAFLSRTGDIEDQAIARAGVFDFLIKTYDRLETHEALAEKSFLTAQRVIESEAATALAQMKARQSAGGGELAALIRQRQDLVAAWQRKDSALTLALATNDETAQLRAALAAVDAEIKSIDSQLLTAFPAFAELQQQNPLTIVEAQSRLGENEILLFFADTGKLATTASETYVWVIPKTGPARWSRLTRSTGELVAAVRELRENMGVGAQTRGPKSLTELEGKDKASRILKAASELHSALLGDIAEDIKGKDLVIVPSRSLAALPFHALISAMPDATSKDRYRDAQWLARDHAITIVPSVASLAPVTPTEETGEANYLAFANPLLLGSKGDDRRAFDRAGCEPAATVLAEVPELPAQPVLTSLFRGATADVAAVRSLQPLPETADEVCAIASLLGASADSLHLGAGATEIAVKAMSDDGTLAKASVLHFATHGLVSGELSGLIEPAIVLTPPDEAGEGDDGLLTASEVTTLKLDADWVILSACNTASSDGGGEALSGLARAFFYAGARALMVSHWPVNSDSAVRLASGAVSELAADPAIGWAEALRRAMVAEIDRGGAAANPANWAPFIVVGAAR